MHRVLLITFVTLLTLTSFGNSAQAESPTGWSPIVVPRGSYRGQIKSLPIEQRPGRLLHVYGNSVRMVRQSAQGEPVRPVRQVVIGTPTVRSELLAGR